MIDEFQHVYRGHKSYLSSEITDLIKELIDKTGTPAFVFGTEELGDINDLDAQFASRLPARYLLRPFVNGEEWQGFLNAFKDQNKFVNLGILSRLAKGLHTATSGSPRTLKFLLVAAVETAFKKEVDVLQEEHLDVAFTKIFGTSTQRVNPFSRE
jgi:hypothetical protein